MTPIVKICGLSTAATLEAALDAGATWSASCSSRRARAISATIRRARSARRRAAARGSSRSRVDADDDALAAIVAATPDYPAIARARDAPRASREIQRTFGVPTIKAIGVAAPADFAAATDYKDVADVLLIDAKPPKDAVLPGGNGVAFDWRARARRFDPQSPGCCRAASTPTMSRRRSRSAGARGVDVSSGVESAPGVKDEGKIGAFIAAARAARFASAAARSEFAGMT